MKRQRHYLYFFLTFSIVSILIGFHWILRDFPDITFHLILFNLLSDMTGMNNAVFFDGLRNFLLYPLIVTLLILWGYRFLNRYFFPYHTLKITLRPSKKVLEFRYHHSDKLIPILATFLVITSIFSMNRVGFFAYVKDMTTVSTFYETYYVPPENQQFTFPDKPKNLIYIVSESMETSFASTDVGGALDENVIPNLTSLYQNNTNFTTGDNMLGFHPAMCTTWTVAALTAQFLGVPLTFPTGVDTDNLDHFLPGAYGLGDVLSQANYNQMAILGSDSDFGSRTVLYTDHGITEILDHPEAINRGLIPSDYNVFWGYEDNKLFDYCQTELLRLAALDEPFFLTTLTVDTHFEDGYVCEDCGHEFQDQYSNVIHCSDKKINEFVQWIQAQDFYEDTVIVIAGDHCTKDRDYLENISPDYTRTVYHTIINADETAAQSALDKNRLYTTMDLYPTTLASMGITWNGDRLALGTNLYGDTPTLMEEMGLEELDNQLSLNSHYYDFHLIHNMQQVPYAKFK